MTKTIITGASGFVGKSLVKELSAKGYEVLAIIRNKNKVSEFDDLSNVSVVVCDLRDISNLKNFLPKTDYSYFFHLAWEGTSGPDREDYHKQLQNVVYTCEAVKTAKELGCKRFIYAGSLMEYESIKYIPINGSIPVKNYIYRTAKLTAHYMAKSLAVDLGIDFVTGTISNAYGEGEISPRLINSTIRILLKNEKTSFTSGEQLYDFIYITDVAKAFIAIAEKGRAYGNYYIGNRTQRKLKDYLIDIKNCIDKNIELGFGEIPFYGASLDYTEFDTNALYEDTDFKCEVDFMEGIKKTIKWIEQNS